MLKNKDREVAKKRQKVWDKFGWVYKGIGYLSQNHSLNCGCVMCRMGTYFRRYDNKKQRLKIKQELKNYKLKS